MFRGFALADWELYQALSVDIHLRAVRFTYENKLAKDVIPEVYKDRVRHLKSMGLSK